VTKLRQGSPLQLAVLLVAVLSASACSSLPFKQQQPPDADQDGIADATDACPTTVSGSPVDADGCSLFRGSIHAVDFEPGDHQLNSASRDSLASLVALLNTHPEVVLQLEGHTDNRGAARDNLELSKRRVMSVVKYLVANGIDGERLKPYGIGENRPIMSNATASGRSENRRIEMSVVTQ